MSVNAAEYIESQKNVHPELIEQYASLSNLYHKKLWHQLTIEVEKYVLLPQLQGNSELIEFYTKFLKDFELKLNALSLVKIAVIISSQYKDRQGALDFVQSIADKVKDDPQARILALSVVAGMKLKAGKVEEAKETIEQAKTVLEGFAGVDAIVNATYYKVWADYYKIKIVPVQFYKSALQYLSYVPIENIPLNERRALGFDLGIAALVGDSIYNFGELLAHDVLQSLEGSPEEWLVQLLRVFNSGDITGWGQLIVKHREQLAAQPALVANQSVLTQKISILALMELAFKRPSDERTIAFQDVAKATKLQANEVEHLIMKALSLKLVRGTIDQVSENVIVTWVQPRVLDIVQIGAMKDRLGQWTSKVQSTLLFMEGETPELLS